MANRKRKNVEEDIIDITVVDDASTGATKRNKTSIVSQNDDHSSAHPSSSCSSSSSAVVSSLTNTASTASSLFSPFLMALDDTTTEFVVPPASSSPLLLMSSTNDNDHSYVLSREHISSFNRSGVSNMARTRVHARGAYLNTNTNRSYHGRQRRRTSQRQELVLLEDGNSSSSSSSSISSSSSLLSSVVARNWHSKFVSASASTPRKTFPGILPDMQSDIVYHFLEFLTPHQIHTIFVHINRSHRLFVCSLPLVRLMQTFSSTFAPLKDIVHEQFFDSFHHFHPKWISAFNNAAVASRANANTDHSSLDTLMKDTNRQNMFFAKQMLMGLQTDKKQILSAEKQCKQHFKTQLLIDAKKKTQALATTICPAMVNGDDIPDETAAKTRYMDVVDSLTLEDFTLELKKEIDPNSSFGDNVSSWSAVWSVLPRPHTNHVHRSVYGVINTYSCDFPLKMSYRSRCRGRYGNTVRKSLYLMREHSPLVPNPHLLSSSYTQPVDVSSTPDDTPWSIASSFLHPPLNPIVAVPQINLNGNANPPVLFPEWIQQGEAIRVFDEDDVHHAFAEYYPWQQMLFGVSFPIEDFVKFISTLFQSDHIPAKHWAVDAMKQVKNQN